MLKKCILLLLLLCVLLESKFHWIKQNLRNISNGQMLVNLKLFALDKIKHKNTGKICWLPGCLAESISLDLNTVKTHLVPDVYKWVM